MKTKHNLITKVAINIITTLMKIQDWIRKQKTQLKIYWQLLQLPKDKLN